MAKFGVVAFAFGAPKSILANLLISTIAKEKARSLGARIYTQLDVPLEADWGIDFVPEIAGSPPPTLRIARGAIAWARQNNINVLCVVAAKPHLPRCLRDLNMVLRREVDAHIAVYPCAGIGKFPVESWFCSDSMQAHTRSSWQWWSREFILRLLPFSIYQLTSEWLASQDPLS